MPDAAARQLTDALLAPLTLDPSVLVEAEGIPETLAAHAMPCPGAGPFRLTDHAVRTALTPRQDAGTDTPFAWSARTARRALGVAAVRSLATGQVRSPTEGVRSRVAQATRSGEGHHPTSAMDRWLASLPAAALNAVVAEAVTWATRLWSALDWSAFETAPTIGRDHWWNSPHSSLLAIRSRAEVRSAVRDSAGQPASVHLVVLGGARRATVRAELSVVALVEALRRSDPLPPGRVVGWWPDSGHLVRVEIDRSTLDTGVVAVARALTSLAGARTPLQAETAAAA
ncbi:MAG TPA: hypothetical protein VG298_14140 [Acidimicrobiales bacterium]|nr:hypothetical protein [Acidimicrobiales bacterium]